MVSPRMVTAPFQGGILAGVALTLLAVPCLGQDKGQQDQDKPAPTHKNVSYGKHERNVLDFWQAKSDKPTPLVVFIHGGGFRAGSKDQISASTLKELLDAGISVAAINYRLVQQSPLPAAHDDAHLALQFLRSKAKDWDLDKTRIGAFGGSAGAQLCMYLAFHDDLADPKSTELVERESTRLTCVAATGGQTTMDFDWWTKNIPGYDKSHRDPLETFGAKTKEEYLAKAKDVSALSLISKDDPPIFMSYGMAPGDPAPKGPKMARTWKVHHVVFGVKLKEEMDKLGIEADLKYPGAKTRYASIPAFFKAKLRGEKK